MGSPITNSEISRWDRLSPSAQKSLAGQVAKRRSREWRQRYAQVHSVGVGYRLCDNASILCEDEICLKFLVNRKYKRLSASEKIPTHVHAYIETKGGRERVAIPTDVDELPQGRAEGDMDIGDGILARPASGGPGLKGAVFCLVRDLDAPSEMFALGCHHVFTRLLQRGSCSPDGSAVLIRADDGLTEIGVIEYWAAMPRNRAFALDLAAVRVTNPAAISAMNDGVFPSRIADPSEEPVDYYIHTPRGAFWADYVSVQYDVPLRFRCGNSTCVFRFATAIQSICDTVVGDSGSPLIGADGELYGMHFYRSGGFALALPSFMLFDADALNMRMGLETTHDP